MGGTKRFEGKVALVTGGVSGIGAAATEQLLAEGATVVAADVSQQGVEDFGAAHPEGALETRRLDVADAAAVTAAVDDIAARHGHLDVVVANAGVVATGRAGDVSDEDWARVLDVDLHGVFSVIRAALPHLVRSAGSIVATSSISGLLGDYERAAYNTAKGAVVNLIRSVALDYAEHGVRANAVAPGVIGTPVTLPIIQADPAVEKTWTDPLPMKRLGRPEEVAAAMLFLASEEASYVSGVTLPVDGALGAWTGQPAI